MLDFQVCKSRQILVPNLVEVVPGSSPPVLEITGSNLKDVEEVLINDIPSPDVLAISSKQILAQVPSQISSTTLIRTVEVLGSQPTSREPAKLFFEIGKTPGVVQGLTKLVQMVIKFLLTTPGRDLYDPGVGGGFLSQVGRIVSRNNTAELMTDLTIGITQTQSQIVEFQSQDPSIPDDERLLSLDIADAFFDKDSASVFVAIRVRSVAGEEAVNRLFI